MVNREFAPVSWIAARQPAVEFVIGLLFVYLLYVLMLSKFFSPSIAPPWFRDLGILWTLSDYVASSLLTTWVFLSSSQRHHCPRLRSHGSGIGFSAVSADSGCLFCPVTMDVVSMAPA